jgi:probable F420-dependent oxidoreductase
MRMGAIFPNNEIEPDVGAIRAWTLAVEEMGYCNILCYDHVIGANAANRPGWQGYDLDSRFHEPMALMSFMAAITSKIGFATSIMILPQRQTVLVAKQASTLDLLSGGRLRLGIGTGWNHVEYEALGMDFAKRGKRFDEQIDVLRALWTQRTVSFATDMHTITDAGIFPMPLQQPIPLWLGGGGVHPIKGWGGVETVLKRIARKGDGWMPTFDPDETGQELVERFRGYCRENGRDPSSVPIEALLLPSMHADWPAHVRAWEALGATQMGVNVGGNALSGVDESLRRLAEVRDVLRDAGLWTDRSEVCP